MPNFAPCKLCGKIPIVRRTDISLIAIVCLTPICNSPVVLACDITTGRKLWERRQRGKITDDVDGLNSLNVNRSSPYTGYKIHFPS